MSKCLCAAGPYDGCGQTFRSLSGFDAHRTGPMAARRCLGADALTALGFVVTDGVWAKPATPDEIARLRSRHSARKAVAPESGTLS
jgi:hypothetical protein